MFIISWLPFILMLLFSLTFCIVGLCYRRSKNAFYWSGTMLVLYGISLGVGYLVVPLISKQVSGIFKRLISSLGADFDTSTVLEPYILILFSLLSFVILMSTVGVLVHRFVVKPRIVIDKKKKRTIHSRLTCMILMGGGALPFNSLLATTVSSTIQIVGYDKLFDFNEINNNVKLLSLTCFNMSPAEFDTLNFATANLLKAVYGNTNYFTQMEKFMDVNPDTPENIVTWLNDVTEAYSFPGEKAWKIQVNYNEDIGGGHLLKDVLTNVLASKIYSDLLCNTFIKDIDVSSDTKIEDPSPILEIWNLLYGNGFHDPNDQEIVYKIRNIENSQVVVSKDFFDIIVDEWVKTRIGESHKEIGEELGQKIIGVIFRYNES